MERTNIEKYSRMRQVCTHFCKGGKVMVTDKYDGKVKKSSISSVYADHTVILPNCVINDYSIFDITLIPIVKS